MSAFIVIQVGQCGNQIGSCLLPQILREYDIKINNETSGKSKRNKTDLQQCMASFFNFNSTPGTFETIEDLLKCNAKARFLCIDMEDSVVARFRTGSFRGLFDQKCLITNYPGSGNNWAEGYYGHGHKYKQKILKTIQYVIEKCDKLHGFLLLFSAGGGTGSGLGTYIVKLLADYYPSIERFVVCVYPTGTEDVITCPYNMAFATEELLESATCVFPVENRSLLAIMTNRSLLLDVNVKQNYNTNYKHISLFKPFEDMNSIIVDMILHLTSGSRFAGKMNVDINEINTNMVPFPNLHFLASGFSPISLTRSKFNVASGQLKNELFLSSCSRHSQLIKIDPLGFRYTSMSLMLLGRGRYSVSDMRIYTEKLQSKLKFAPWSQKALKVGLCNVAPKGQDFSMCTLCNTSAMSTLFSEILMQFMKLYRRKAHTHHYTDVPGFDSISFNECQNSMNNVIELYKEIDGMKASQS